MRLLKGHKGRAAAAGTAISLVGVLVGLLAFGGLGQAQAPTSSCRPGEQELGLEDPLEMNTVALNVGGRDLVKTIKVDKEIWLCDDNGDFVTDRIVDIQIFTEIVERILKRPTATAADTATLVSSQFPVVSKTFEVVICEKNLDLSVKCRTQQLEPFSPVIQDIKCGGPQRVDVRPPSDPIEMNTVVAGSFVKTVKAQKEILGCTTPDGLEVIVDVETFTEIIEQATADSIKPVLKRVEVSFCLKPAFPPPSDPNQLANPFVISCHFEPEQVLFAEEPQR